MLELLIVISVIAVLAVALVPAVGTFTKSVGRKGAVTNLLGVFEQARAEAIKSGLNTYVVFPTFTSGQKNTLDRYNYKSYAIFQDDPAQASTPKQLTNWKTLPTGITLRKSLTSALVLPSALSSSPTFSFSSDSTAAPTFYCAQFNSNGEMEMPASNATLMVFEGYIDSSGNEVATSAKNSGGQIIATGGLMISHLTGRATYVNP